MKTIHVVAAIIINGEKIFATQRGYGEFQGQWEFPGGKKENFETSQEALIREIKEELDVKIQITSLFQTITYDYPTFHLNMECFLCQMPDEEIKLIEHSDFRWLGINDLDSVNWLPADISIIEKLKVYLSNLS